MSARDENEPGQLGNREIITVCIAVSLAVILVASLMPAMLPQGGGDEPSDYEIAIVERVGESKGLYIGTFDNDGNLTRDFVANTTDPDTVFMRDNGYIRFDSATFKIVGGENSVKLLDRMGEVILVATDAQTLYDYVESHGWLSLIMSADLLWDFFTCPNQALPGETPEPPEPSGGSDNTTAIVMAIIAIIFLGIALTALRTVLPSRGGQ